MRARQKLTSAIFFCSDVLAYSGCYKRMSEARELNKRQKLILHSSGRGSRRSRHRQIDMW